MSHRQQLISPLARTFENQLSEPGDNCSKQRLGELAALSPATQELASGSYHLYLTREHPEAGAEIFGPSKPLLLGKYDESDLYGGAKSTPSIAFKSALKLLKDRATRLSRLDQETTEFGHQAALFWADVGALKCFIGTSPVMTEVVAELRTARFQFLGKDTPPSIFKAMESALGGFVDSPRWDSSAVDRFVEGLEQAGYDSLVIDSLRTSNGGSVS